MSDCDRWRYKGTKRTRLHGESDDWKKFPIPPGFESPMSFTLQKVKNNEKARKSTAVGESEQDPSQTASTSTIVSIGKLKSSIRSWPWILDDHVDHIEEDSGCETDKVIGNRKKWRIFFKIFIAKCDNKGRTRWYVLTQEKNTNLAIDIWIIEEE
ncbi:hypothetical protein CQW23_30683 [Capsicum baccatum]|uniref:Uncharacterized protein n=1 Tax=Capsicum baccatum TaxID=33114 RepID=A0A2G2V9Q2_CAPBA|nr:hypothetical protein CQW23_30683 [Capsicum baccatum]